jgi:hypothetical protein
MGRKPGKPQMLVIVTFLIHRPKLSLTVNSHQIVSKQKRSFGCFVGLAGSKLGTSRLPAIFAASCQTSPCWANRAEHRHVPTRWDSQACPVSRRHRRQAIPPIHGRFWDIWDGILRVWGSGAMRFNREIYWDYFSVEIEFRRPPRNIICSKRSFPNNAITLKKAYFPTVH